MPLPKRLKVCKKCGRVLLEGKKWVYDPKLLERAKRFGIPIVYDVCDECKKPLDYHNAIVQIRGKNFDKHFEEAMSFLDKRGAFYFIDKDDLKIRYKKDARALARFLEQRGAEIKMSAKVVGYDRQKSKQLQRLFISARFPYAEGDVVLYKNRPYAIEGFGKNILFLSGFGKVNKSMVKDARDIEVRDAIVISEKPFLVLVDQRETVEPDVEGISPLPKQGKRVRVAFYKGRWYLI